MKINVARGSLVEGLPSVVRQSRPYPMPPSRRESGRNRFEVTRGPGLVF